MPVQQIVAWLQADAFIPQLTAMMDWPARLIPATRSRDAHILLLCATTTIYVPPIHATMPLVVRMLL